MSKKIKTENFRSLTVTLAIAFLAISIVVLLISGGLSTFLNLKTQQQVVSSQQQLIAQEAAGTVSDFIQKKFAVLQTAIRLGDLLVTQKEKQKLVLDKLLGAEPAFRQLVLFDQQHQESLWSSRVSDLMSGGLANRTGDELFSRTEQNKAYISSVYIDAVTSEPMIIIAVPVTDVFDDPKGLLAAEVNLKFMWDLMDSIKIGDKGLAYVVDKEGNLIAFGDISRVLRGENLNKAKEVAEFMKGSKKCHKDGADISKGINNTYVVTTHAHLDVPDWAVIVELPINEAYENIIANLQLTAWIMLANLMLAIVVGVYLSKKITKPIIGLRDATRAISKGGLDTKIEVKSKDEIGQLAESFNQMVEDLNRTTVSRDSLMGEVNEREKVEKGLKETMEKLEQANLNMKQFVYVASHDLREPLRKITSFGGILKESLGDKITGDDAENLNYMISGAERMSQMIDGLLSYSRVSTKGKPSEVIDLNELVNQLKELELSILIEEKNVTFEIPKELPAVEADPVQIRQLLQNLIANGIKYQPKDNTPHIKITSRPADNGMVRIEVTDNGIGIKPENQQTVFEMFRRLHTRNEYEGTGIGLSVCKKIVERHGGQIGLESEYGKGSTFWFTVLVAERVTC